MSTKKLQTINVRVSLDLKIKLQALADKDKRSLSNLVIYLLEQAIEESKQGQ
jgi:predicted transcriptional regulator